MRMRLRMWKWRVRAVAERRHSGSRDRAPDLTGRDVSSSAPRTRAVPTEFIPHKRPARALPQPGCHPFVLDAEEASAVLGVALGLADLEHLGHLHGRLAGGPDLLDLSQHRAELVVAIRGVLGRRELFACLYDQKSNVDGPR